MRVCMLADGDAQGPDSAYDPSTQQLTESNSGSPDSRVSVVSGWTYLSFEFSAYPFLGELSFAVVISHAVHIAMSTALLDSCPLSLHAT